MKKIKLIFCLSSLLCLIFFVENQTLIAQSIDVLYIPWKVHTVVGLDKKQFIECSLTHKITIYQQDTIALIENEFNQIINGETIGNYEPDIRMICTINKVDGSKTEFFFDREKDIYYQGKTYRRNMGIIKLIECYTK